jgi:peptidoglycan/LPS O-acetylase OafA/YrhL
MYRPLGTFRFVLALIVVFWHSGPICQLNDGVLARFQYGEMAVMVFFFLSGFIITETSSKFYPCRPYAFISNRFIRLLPSYIFALFISVVVLTSFKSELLTNENLVSADNVVANVFSIFPFVFITDTILKVTSRMDILGIIWSLRVEFAFYFFIMLKLYFEKNNSHTVSAQVFYFTI